AAELRQAPSRHLGRRHGPRPRLPALRASPRRRTPSRERAPLRAVPPRRGEPRARRPRGGHGGAPADRPTDGVTTMDAAVSRRLLFEMLRIRLVEETIADRYPEGEMRCPVHLSIGQEAVAVGVAASLAADDCLMSAHRAHAHYLAKGGDLTALLAELYGRATGCSSGRGGSMHLVDLDVNMLGSTPIVGSALPVAVGTAFGAWQQGRGGVTVVFVGEGATEQGVFAECLNFAALKRLALVFVCENNLYSVYSPLDVRQAPARDRAALATAHGIPTASGDGNDVEAVVAATLAATARARRGDGPTYLEFATYRWREHCGPNYDNDLGYRTEEEFLFWKQRCPIEGTRRELLAARLVDEHELQKMNDDIGREIDQAVDFAERSPFPVRDDMAKNVYAK